MKRSYKWILIQRKGLVSRKTSQNISPPVLLQCTLKVKVYMTLDFCNGNSQYLFTVFYKMELWKGITLDQVHDKGEKPNHWFSHQFPNLIHLVWSHSLCREFIVLISHACQFSPLRLKASRSSESKSAWEQRIRTLPTATQPQLKLFLPLVSYCDTKGDWECQW